jgi:tRNA modification GTPase
VDIDDTIVAIASPLVAAARGIVRVSGPGTLDVLSRLGVPDPQGTAARCVAADVDVGCPIGRVPARVLIWPTNRSYSGQPSAEFHTFGSLPVLQALVDVVARHGARAARPGEFTMRAFLAGRLDLTQAEAVLGVIEAESRGSLDHALRQLAGNLSRPLESMRATMLDLLADVEAGLDFVDEDIEFISEQNLIQRLTELSGQLDQTMELLGHRDGVTATTIVTFRGEPNAGKSQLVNCLAGREAAIVADVAGTTRDVVTTEIEIEQRPLTLVDTAGIEEALTDDLLATLTLQSQAQAQRASDGAHVRVWCVDCSREDFDAARTRLESKANQDRRDGLDVWVATKLDQVDSLALPAGWLATSSITHTGIDQLKRVIAEFINNCDREETGSVIGTAARCRGTLRLAAEAIERASETCETGQGHEFVSAELRLAAECLGEVTGAVYTDDILDRVFSRFCIGK